MVVLGAKAEVVAHHDSNGSRSARGIEIGKDIISAPSPMHRTVSRSGRATAAPALPESATDRAVLGRPDETGVVGDLRRRTG